MSHRVPDWIITLQRRACPAYRIGSHCLAQVRRGTGGLAFEASIPHTTIAQQNVRTPDALVPDNALLTGEFKAPALSDKDRISAQARKPRSPRMVKPAILKPNLYANSYTISEEELAESFTLAKRRRPRHTFRPGPTSKLNTL